jgi:hypothetical protein
MSVMKEEIEDEIAHMSWGTAGGQKILCIVIFKKDLPSQ